MLIIVLLAQQLSQQVLSRRISAPTARAAALAAAVVLGTAITLTCHAAGAANTAMQRAHDGALEAQAQADDEAVAERARQDAAVLVEVELGQEAERAEREGEHRRYDALEEPAGVEHGAIAAKLQPKTRVSIDQKGA